MLGSLSLAAVHGQTTVHYDFEDGRMRGTAVPMKVPPKMLTEGGNTFMRITGSRGDCQASPAIVSAKEPVHGVVDRALLQHAAHDQRQYAPDLQRGYALPR